LGNGLFVFFFSAHNKPSPFFYTYSTITLVLPMSTTDVWRGIAPSSDTWN